VPRSVAAEQALASDRNLIEPILTGGEDYEILCAVAPERIAVFMADAARMGVPVADIGRIVGGEGPPRFLNPEGNALPFIRPSFSHF
jgi:thiamine-monophosphate kinase